LGQALYAFLVEKGNRSGSSRTVESYSRMLWPFFAERGKTPDPVKPTDVLAWVHGISRSGRTPSPTTLGARIACLSSFYARFRRHLATAGLAPTGIHVLRHTATKLRRDAGASIESISQFLHHSSLAVPNGCLRRLEGEADRTWPDVAAAIGLRK
jgi:integrase